MAVETSFFYKNARFAANQLEAELLVYYHTSERLEQADVHPPHGALLALVGLRARPADGLLVRQGQPMSLKKTLNSHWQYAKYVARHKLYVYQAGRKLGVGRFQLILHDWHKMTPAEWFPYVEMFYGGPHGNGWGWARGMYGQPDYAEAQARFDEAWLRHQNRGKHHWQWWVLVEDGGDTKCLPMPDKYRREMVADWKGAGRAITGRDETAEWYEKNKGKMQLHPSTRAWVERALKGRGG